MRAPSLSMCREGTTGQHTYFELLFRAEGGELWELPFLWTMLKSWPWINIEPHPTLPGRKEEKLAYLSVCKDTKLKARSVWLKNKTGPAAQFDNRCELQSKILRCNRNSSTRGFYVKLLIVKLGCLIPLPCGQDHIFIMQHRRYTTRLQGTVLCHPVHN